MSDFLKINRNGQILEIIVLRDIEKKVDRTKVYEI
jgi:hypothetical protein